MVWIIGNKATIIGPASIATHGVPLVFAVSMVINPRIATPLTLPRVSPIARRTSMVNALTVGTLKNTLHPNLPLLVAKANIGILMKIQLARHVKKASVMHA